MLTPIYEEVPHQTVIISFAAAEIANTVFALLVPDADAHLKHADARLKPDNDVHLKTDAHVFLTNILPTI